MANELNNTEIFLDVDDAVSKIKKERDFFLSKVELTESKDNISLVYSEYITKLMQMKIVRSKMLSVIEEAELRNMNRFKKDAISGSGFVTEVVFNNNNTQIKDANFILWSPKQNDIRMKQQDFETKVVGDSFSKKDDFDKIMRISVRSKEVKDKITEKEKKLSRELTLSEKHFIRDDVRVTNLFNFAKDKNVTLEDCKAYMENKETLQTLGNEVMVVLRPYDKDSKKPKSTNKDRIEYKMNENINNPNVAYGFFHEFKEDKDGNILLVIRDKQRILIGETADASVTNYAWSQFPVTRIKRFFVKTSTEWIEIDPKDKSAFYKIKDIWKEVDVNNPLNQD